MRALVIGSGAREHALAARLGEEGWQVACAPGNAGIARRLRCVPLDPGDLDAAVALARKERPDLVVVGPEAPLVAGLADRLAAEGLAVFGPSALAARIEGSKAFAKTVMVEAGIPTAAYGTFEEPAAARAYAQARGGRVVVKADGLAAGKGVTVCGDLAEANVAIDAALVRGELGAAGRRVVVEQRLEGRELSLMAICDGRRYLLLPPSQDYKRVGDGDEGPNTGGMGAVSPPMTCCGLRPPPGPPRRLEGGKPPGRQSRPPPELPRQSMRELAALAIEPALERLAVLGAPFRGALYAGLMLTADGPRVLEYNCRLGDPETQVLVERVEGPLGEAMLAAARGDLGGAALGERPGAAVGVVVCAEGYPRSPRVGDPIAGLDDAEAMARLRYGGVGGAPERPVTAGGRVLTAVGRGADVAEARAQAYGAVARIRFPGAHHRRDIGGR